MMVWVLWAIDDEILNRRLSKFVANRKLPLEMSESLFQKMMGLCEFKKLPTNKLGSLSLERTRRVWALFCMIGNMGSWSEGLEGWEFTKMKILLRSLSFP
ncbi:hypothetical protein A3D69_01735 [Candidatus Uhrbacteria bacterium RIFCSPHIGHO2_02_FULL_54_11]|nr:MAG: hypothetical protein A3D69_01735 [Candidatus Uhrbacteria bacterium RIFCSPHIGHO2_02_FULL_54_11]